MRLQPGKLQSRGLYISVLPAGQEPVVVFPRKLLPQTTSQVSPAKTSPQFDQSIEHGTFFGIAQVVCGMQPVNSYFDWQSSPILHITVGDPSYLGAHCHVNFRVLGSMPMLI
jgi:hypothetical protein